MAAVLELENATIVSLVSLPTREFKITAQDIPLNVLELGNPQGQPIICVHGLRDTAHALSPIFSNGWDKQIPYRVLIPELRGHGLSGATDAFAMANFLQDVLAIIDHENLDQLALFGHSLGGHITCKIAAMWPERISALMVVEGLGPPARAHDGDEQLEVQAYRYMLENRLSPRPSKPISGLTNATQRLLRNNPRLAPEEAARLAPHLTRSAGGGRLSWAFDSRAASVFIGSDGRENEKFWRQIQAPTCIVSGTLSYEYWGQQMSADDFSGKFAEGEMENRAAQFRNHEHHWFDHSGHMVHYDEPNRLGLLCRKFLEKHYV